VARTAQVRFPEGTVSARSRFGAALADVRRPEYTGDDRCVPCTVVNVAIAALVAIGAASVLVTPVGVVVFLACLAVIYLRGYLLPGTPELTQRYFPPWLLARFGKDAPIGNAFEVGGSDRARGATMAEPTTSTVADPDSRAGEFETTTDIAAAETEGPLFAASVLARNEEGTVVLAPSFREAWRDRIATVRERGVEPADVRALFDAGDVRQVGEASFVLDGSASVRWESRAALLADVAAGALLDERLASWEAFERDERRTTLTGLRLFLEECPVCEGTIESGEERVDPCCQKPHRLASATCEECGASLADAAIPDDEDRPVRVRLVGS
jgi:hypothetical protein